MDRAPEPSRSPSTQSLRSLDAVNFLLADVQTGVGPFLALYLATHGWNEARVGWALTVAGIAGILTQTPLGGLADSVRSKRALLAAAVVAVASGALVIGLAALCFAGCKQARTQRAFGFHQRVACYALDHFALRKKRCQNVSNEYISQPPRRSPRSR